MPGTTVIVTNLGKLAPICQTPKGIAQQLNRHTLDLLDAGIEVSFLRRHGGDRIITLDASPDSLPPPQLLEPQEVASP